MITVHLLTITDKTIKTLNSINIDTSARTQRSHGKSTSKQRAVYNRRATVGYIDTVIPDPTVLSDSKRHFFSVPANKCADWNRRIPRDGVLSTKHLLYDLHFEEHFLVKADILNRGGKAESFPRLRWSLTDDAIPTLFPNIPKYLSKRIVV